VSIFSIQTVRQLSKELGIDLDKRRFRANLYIELESGKGFGEDEFVGRTLRIGAKTAIAVAASELRMLFHAHNFLPPGVSRHVALTALRIESMRVIAVSEYVASYLRNTVPADRLSVVLVGNVAAFGSSLKGVGFNSYETVELLAAYEWSGLELYAGPSYIVHTSTPLDRNSFQAGLNYRSAPIGIGSAILVGGVDYSSWQETDWDSDVSVKAGVELNPEATRRTIRILLEYYNGHLPYGQSLPRRSDRLPGRRVRKSLDGE
jgi:hypothetical protein